MRKAECRAKAEKDRSKKSKFMAVSGILCLSLCLLHGPAIIYADAPVRVYADIVGDLFHSGHVEFFKKARELGDQLIIGVLSDEDVKSYKRIPILTLEERAAVIGACKYVDEVVLAPPLRLTEEWIREHHIDLVVHGDDFNQDLLMDQYGVSIEMGIFRSVPYCKGISTTNIIQRIVERYVTPSESHIPSSQ